MQYQNISGFLLQYYDLIGCMDSFSPSLEYDYYGICAYKPKPSYLWRSNSLPRWW